MVKIIFKEVGQGDSIILEWQEEYKSKIGIIDCNISRESNPILAHLIEHKVKQIEFLILSHPHFDHFSGFRQVLEYCRENNIAINRFLHTSIMTPQYLKSSTKTAEASDELLKLFLLLKDMRDAGELEIFSIDDNPNLVIPLGSDFNMEVLAPSSKEIDNYVKGIKFPFSEEGSHNNANANWLSTIFKIYNENYSALLTSDVESTSLSRVGKKNKSRLNGVIGLAQIPHHGSRWNLNKKFWSMRKRKENTPVVISVGENGYGHPADEVISFFEKNPNYVVHFTNTPAMLRQNIVSSILDVISSETNSNINTSGDKTFVLEQFGCKIY